MRTILLVFCLVTACTASADTPKEGTSHSGTAGGAIAADSTRNTRDTTQAGATGATKSKDPEPRIVRALYVNRWATHSPRRMAKLIAAADSTEINAFVLDMKDEFGLNYNTQHAEFEPNAGTATKANVPALLDTLKKHNILPIARIVVFKDSVTARVHPEWTIRKADGSIWRDKKGIAWVNPYHKELWEYNIGVAEELVKM